MTSTICKSCGFRFDAPDPVPVLGVVFKISTCPSCRQASIESASAHELATKRLLAERAWNNICPPIYQDTDPARLDAKLLAQVMAWQYGAKGLLLSGPSEKGKTRAMFLLVKRLVIEELRDVLVFHGNEFAHQCAREFGNQTGEEWAARVSKAQVVFFDDLGKFKLTERVEAELFGIVEMRSAWKRPTLWTTNFKSAELESKMSADRGNPLVRRVKEFSEIIQAK